MRLLTSVTTLAAGTVVWSPPFTANAFVLLPASTSTASRRRSPVSSSFGAIVGGSNDDDRSRQTACDIPSEFDGGGTPSLVGVTNGANAIRSAVVTNSAGDFVRIDDAMKYATSRVAAAAKIAAPHVVVYLRHMG
jgi:hypothetical protein